MEPKGPLGPRITGVEHEVEAIRKKAKEMEEKMTAENHSGNQNVNVFRFEGGKSVLVSLLVGLVGGVCLGLSVAVVGWVSYSLTRQDNMNNWTAQEVTAIRSYITNGKLVPMEPRPFGPEKEKKP